MNIAQTLTAGSDDRSLEQSVVEIQPVGFRWAMTTDGGGDNNGTDGACSEPGTSYRCVRTGDGYAGGGARSNWLWEEIELLICSARGCFMVLMFVLCVREREDD